jgi:hypothetical protein
MHYRQPCAAWWWCFLSSAVPSEVDDFTVIFMYALYTFLCCYSHVGPVPSILGGSGKGLPSSVVVLTLVVECCESIFAAVSLFIIMVHLGDLLLLHQRMCPCLRSSLRLMRPSAVQLGRFVSFGKFHSSFSCSPYDQYPP